MNNNTFLNWTERIKIQANKTGIELEFTIGAGDVKISHSGPWIVEVKIENLKIDVKDEKNTASWTITKDFTKKINITTDPTSPESAKKFVDPLYLVYNNGLVNNTIRETPITDFSTQLTTHLINSYYRVHSDAPSYLNRFEEDKKFTASANGIESLVNSQKLIDEPSLSPNAKTAVDYIYYDDLNTPTDDQIEGMELTHPWFYLDYIPPCIPESLHMAYYEATGDVP